MVPCLKPNKYQRTGRDHFERWKLKGTSNHQSRIVEEALQEAIEENSEDSSVLSLSDLLETEIEKIGNFVKTLNFETEGKAFKLLLTTRWRALTVLETLGHWSVLVSPNIQICLCVT